MSRELVRALALPQTGDGPVRRRGKRLCLLTQAKCDVVVAIVHGDRAWEFRGGTIHAEFNLCTRPVPGTAVVVAHVRRYYGHLDETKHWAPCFCNFDKHQGEDEDEEGDEDEDDDEGAGHKRRRKRRGPGPDPDEDCEWPLLFLGFLSSYTPLLLPNEYAWTSAFHTMTQSRYVEWHRDVTNIWRPDVDITPLAPEDQTLLKGLRAARAGRGMLKPEYIKLISAPSVPTGARLEALLARVDLIKKKSTLADRLRLWYHWHLHKYGEWSFWDFLVTGGLEESYAFVVLISHLVAGGYLSFRELIDRHLALTPVRPGVGGVLPPDADVRVREFLVQANVLTSTPPPKPTPILLLLDDGHSEMALHQAMAERSELVPLVSAPWIDDEALLEALRPYLGLPLGRVGVLASNASVIPFYTKFVAENNIVHTQINVVTSLQVNLMATTSIVLLIGAHIPSQAVALLVTTRNRSNLKTVLVGDPFLGRPRTHTAWSTWTSGHELPDVEPFRGATSVRRGLTKQDCDWDPYLPQPFVGDATFYPQVLSVRARRDTWMNYVLATLKPQRVILVVLLWGRNSSR